MHHKSMERQPDCRRRRAQDTNGLVAQAKINFLPCQQDDDSQGGERDIQMPNLPEVRYDILLTLGSVQVKCQ
ncbi:unnamed protein product [Urochloa humidicola]